MNYTFYVLDPDGQLGHATVVDCTDDAAARAHAWRSLGIFNAAVEAWQGSRKIVHIGQLPGFSHVAHMTATRDSRARDSLA
jgi:hypothetical protein